MYKKRKVKDMGETRQGVIQVQSKLTILYDELILNAGWVGVFFVVVFFVFFF